jgi:hypothetical protein
LRPEQAVIGIHNAGERSREPAGAHLRLRRQRWPGREAAARRGQGLFVARTYMAKMGGSVRALNSGGGVRFELGCRSSAERPTPRRAGLR